jgi:hypothetical protein
LALHDDRCTFCIKNVIRQSYYSTLARPEWKSWRCVSWWSVALTTPRNGNFALITRYTFPRNPWPSLVFNSCLLILAMTSKKFNTCGYVANSSLSAMGTWAEGTQLLSTSVDEKVNHHFGEWPKHQDHGFSIHLF